jgi:antitoxin component YwqK of YwqJK toxin-antitoxin module
VKPDPVDTNIPQPSITCPSGKSKTSTYGEHTITYGVTTGPGGDDIMHGSLQWKNGSTIITKGCCKNNKMYGHWSAWHAANAAKSTQFYYNALGKMSGMQRSWYEAGGKYFEGVFKNGERIGLIQRWHEDGTLRDKVWFDAKGELHGLFQSWHENGAKDLVQTFIHGKAQGLTQGWFDKGQKAFEGAWDKGLEEGVHTDWHEAGGISGKNTYSKGNGDVKLSHENGKPAVVGSRKDGERHGVWNWWDDKGNKLFHVEFTLGSGPFTEWFENGKIRRQGTYKEEQRHGPYKEWADTGNLVSDGSYFEGSQHGSWTFYDDKGAKAYTLCIVHGSITRFEPCTSGMLN